MKYSILRWNILSLGEISLLPNGKILRTSELIAVETENMENAYQKLKKPLNNYPILQLEDGSGFRNVDETLPWSNI